MNQLFSLFNGNTTSVQGVPLEPEKELYQSVPGIPSDDSEDPSYTALRLKSTSKRRSSEGRRSDEDLKASVLNQKLCDLDVDCSKSLNCDTGNCQDHPGFLRWLMASREEFWGSRGSLPLTSKGRKRKIRDILSRAYRGAGKFEFSYTTHYEGEERVNVICEHCYFGAVTAGNKTKQWYTIMNEFKHEGTAPKSSKGDGRYAAKADQIQAWISNFLESCDDPAGRGLEGKKFLPFPNVGQFYAEYERRFTPAVLFLFGNSEALDRLDDKASLSTFKRVFDKHFKSYVKLMKDYGNHTGCDVCINAAVILQDLGRNFPPAAQDIISQFRSLHIKQQWQERDDMTARELKARDTYDKLTGNPSYFYICTDYVSSWVGDTPRFLGAGRKSKSDESKSKIKTKMCGVRVFCGPLHETMIFYIDNTVSGGCNVMIEIIRRTLYEIAKRLKDDWKMKLPKDGFFEFDNCGADNKNWYLFSYFHLLVDLQYFDSIQVNYLISGHSHNPLDQTNGSYSKVIHDQEFIASPMALEALLQAHKGTGAFMKPRVFQQIDVVYDYRKAMEPFLNKKVTNLFTCHSYLFERHPLFNRTHLMYSMFSDQPLKPDHRLLAALHTGKSEPIFSNGLDVDDNFAFVGGKQKFYDSLQLAKPSHELTEEDAKTFTAVSSLERGGTFHDLHTGICRSIGEL